MKKLWLPLLLGTLVTAVLSPLGVIYSKGGGETFSIIFFPFLSILSLIFRGTPGILAIVVSYTFFFLQYPLYFVILKIALDRNKFYKVLLALLGLHITGSFICFAIYRARS